MLTHPKNKATSSRYAIAMSKRSKATCSRYATSCSSGRDDHPLFPWRKWKSRKCQGYSPKYMYIPQGKYQVIIPPREDVPWYQRPYSWLVRRAFLFLLHSISHTWRAERPKCCVSGIILTILDCILICRWFCIISLIFPYLKNSLHHTFWQ